MQINDQGFVYSRAELKALVNYAATDDLRPHLQNVVLDPRASRAYATDGRRLAVCRAPGSVGAFERMLLPRTTIEQIMRAASKKTHVIHVSSEAVLSILDERTMTIAMTCKIDPYVTPKGKVPFPEIDDVLPSPVDMAHRESAAPLFGVNGHYLADMALVCDAAQTPEVHFMPMSCDGGVALGPMLLVCGDWHVVMMPMHIAYGVAQGRADRKRHEANAAA